ncbi:MAG: hypothetical protein POG24_06400 [Acidocella sp.]|nr:hypothetical protein [Acidocella sp.]
MLPTTHHGNHILMYLEWSIVKNTYRAALIVAGFFPLVSGCAAPPAPPSPSATLPVAATSAATTGVIAAVRVTDSNSLGVNAVLSALHEPLPAQPTQRAEVVIVKKDGNAISAMQADPTPNLAPGAPITVIETASTNPVRQN